MTLFKRKGKDKPKASVFLHAATGAYSGASVLAHGIQKYCDPDLVSMIGKDRENFHTLYKSTGWRKDRDAIKMAMEKEQWVFCGAISFYEFWRRHREFLPRDFLRTKTIKVILTDSRYCKKHNAINRDFKELGIIMYAMTDLYKYCDPDQNPIPYYPPNVDEDLIHTEIDKEPKKIILCHSPFAKKVKLNLKGTKQILEAFDKMEDKYPIVEQMLITNCSRQETLRRKGTTHIFVDQLIYKNPNVPQRWGNVIYDGGLGKSGCEGMMLKNLVITGGLKIDTEPYFPPPPVVWVNFQNFERKLEFFIRRSRKRRTLAKAQYKWAVRYLTPEFVANHVVYGHLKKQ